MEVSVPVLGGPTRLFRRAMRGVGRNAGDGIC